jgi:hypothetical protein
VVNGKIDPLAVIARTDRALYQAKRQGRNCVAVADTPAVGELDAPSAAGRGLRMVN